ncbi:MAG: AMP-binding protein [Solirubrobacteraceae bacterium]|nr:AMP-binding protein [Solirubrobacteraceae bacterium]
MNFAREVVEAAPPGALALVELARDGSRREWTFGEIAAGAAAMAGALGAAGVRRGDVVLTLLGNRPEWVMTMVACLRAGYVALPCTEQLRAHDLRLRLDVARPAAIVCDERNRDQLEAAGPACPVMLIPDPRLFDPQAQPVPPPHAALDAAEPCLITFTSGTAGEPKAVVHGQRYLVGQALQAESWLDARRGELVWCTASSGWSKSARNVFIAPWLRGAPALLHDARFDPHERLAILERESVGVLCMAPTEFRVIVARAQPRRVPSLRGLVAAGEALNPEVLRAFHEATGLWIRDGYGQTETGQTTGQPAGEAPRPGSMGRPLPGIELWIEDGELCLDPHSDPTFFVGYLGDGVRRADGGGWTIEADRRDGGVWRTGDRVTRDEDGYLFFEGRADDVIISAGYRIGPFEVESALVAHPAVAEAAAVAAPDDERGSVVRAVVVLREGHAPGAALARELQEHVKALTAPYKYPRIVDFAVELPKTASGKVIRGALRGH